MLDNFLESYKQQTLKVFNMSPLVQKALGSTNEMQVFQAEGGLFADCAIEAQITNVTFNPIASLANMIPVIPTVSQKLKFAFLTDIANPSGTLPATPCSDSQTIGDVSACFAEFSLGRLSYQTKTGEMDDLLNVAHRGIRNDLYLVGNIRGVSAPISIAQQSDRDFVSRAAVRRQISLLGRAIQNEVIKSFWTGDPTNGAANTVGGGRKQFWGLDSLIANDYASKTFVDGDNCAKLNADVKTFTTGAFNIGTQALYQTLSTLESTIYNKALLTGLLPFEAAIVMNPVMWQGVVEALPLQMLSSFTAGVTGSVNLQIELNSGSDMSVAFMRQQLQNTMSIPVNGRNYPVILDSGIPVVEDAVTNAPDVDYTSTIYFVPLSVANEPTLYWVHKDYSQFDEMLQPIPGTMDMRGWTDRLNGGGALYHYAIRYNKRCFDIDVKTELGLVFTAPFLSGRIDGVTYRRIQTIDIWS